MKKIVTLFSITAAVLSFSQTSASAETTHTVKSGETLWKIANSYKVSTANLKSWNHLNSDIIKVGQKLVINNGDKKVTATVNANGLNVRTEPGLNAKIITKLSKGTSVTITEEKAGWVFINTSSVKGWVSSQYVKLTNTANTSSVSTSKQYVVTASKLNVRSSASLSASVVSSLAKSTTVNVTKQSAGWSYIEAGTKKGWVSSQYLSEAAAQTKPTSSIKNRTVILDAGHGGKDSGAIGTDGTQEKSITLAIALKTKAELQRNGYNVVMTRETDRKCLNDSSQQSELKCRVNVATKNRGDIFVSIHANQGVNASGSETYYNKSRSPYATQSNKLATYIHNNYQPAFGSKDRGVRDAEFYVIKYNTMPSVLLEIGFLSNSHDLANMKSPTMQQRVASSIAKGVNQYFGY
ncbi:N-acetylmuramoyl-L-alanine amidase [Priestia filamentosa]|uniref:N-acetylmuramoyl-L-alanine amidase n=1 Tax=Priestia filamentosa TaxID=1402861 RepID=UPI0039786D13